MATCTILQKPPHKHKGMRGTWGSILVTSSNLESSFEAILCLEAINFEQKRKSPMGAPKYLKVWHMRTLYHHWKGAAHIVTTEKLTFCKFDEYTKRRT